MRPLPSPSPSFFEADFPSSDVLNRGLSGYNSEWSLACWNKWLSPTTSTSPKTQLVTLWLGANDAVLPGEAQHVPLDRYQSNLRSIVALVRERHPEASIVLITPTPYHPEGWLDERVRRGLTRTHDRAPERTKEYAEAVTQLGEELGLPVADVWTPVDAEMRRLGPEKEGSVFTDGLHLNAGAYKHVVDGASKCTARSLVGSATVLFPDARRQQRSSRPSSRTTQTRRPTRSLCCSPTGRTSVRPCLCPTSSLPR